MRIRMPVRVFSHGEDAMWRCEERNPREVKDDPNYRPVEYVIGDIRDREAVRNAMKGVTHVVNTAAMKHVRYGTENPDELIKTNVVGLSNLLAESLAEDVLCFVQISTDKVANAENIYGTSKKMGEDMVAATGRPNYFSIRFGNFLGSRGSVLEKWKEQANAFKGIKLTDRRMNRFFIKPREVSKFIVPFVMHPDMEAGSVAIPIMKVFNMGTIADIWHDIYGCEVEVVGAGEGEKLDEHIITRQEAPRTVQYPKCYIIHPHPQKEGLSIPIGTDVLPKQTMGETYDYLGEFLHG